MEYLNDLTAPADYNICFFRSGFRLPRHKKVEAMKNSRNWQEKTYLTSFLDLNLLSKHLNVDYGEF